MLKILIIGKKSFLGGRLKKFLENKFKISIKSHNEIKKLNTNYDVLIHLSGPDALFCENFPKKSISIRKKITKDLLKFAKTHKVNKFIYISTTHVYKKKHSLIDENSILENKFYYALSHLAAEKEILKFDKKKLNTEYKILRLANCFGYPVKKNANCWSIIINNICRQVYEDNKILIHSKKNIFKDYLPIKTFCQIVEFFIKLKNNKKIIFNISTGKSLSINYILKKINDKKKVNIIKFFNGNGLKITYSNKRLLNIKKNIKDNFDEELVNLLSFCRKKFH